MNQQSLLWYTQDNNTQLGLLKLIILCIKCCLHHCSCHDSSLFKNFFIVAIYQPLQHPPESEVFYQQYRRQEQRLLLSNLPYIPRVNVVCTIIWFMVHVFWVLCIQKCGWANIFYSNLFFIQTRKWNIKNISIKK